MKVILGKIVLTKISKTSKTVKTGKKRYRYAYAEILLPLDFLEKTPFRVGDEVAVAVNGSVLEVVKAEELEKRLPLYID